MKVTKVCCQGCGADLEVNEEIRFVTCNYCNARLEVVHDQTTTHTKLLDELVEKTESMAGDLRVIQAEMELQRIDRAWETTRRAFLNTDKHGHVSEPSAAGSVVGGIVGIVVGVIWMVLVGNSPAPTPFALFGLLFIGVSIFGMIQGSAKHSNYQSAQRLYQHERKKALRKIAEAKQAAD